MTAAAGLPTTYAGFDNSAEELTFCIPIYSGIIGVMMPDKKLIPMSLMPLEIEFTMNPYAFYTVGGNVDLIGANPTWHGAMASRGYTVSRFEIFAHTLFFE